MKKPTRTTRIAKVGPHVDPWRRIVSRDHGDPMDRLKLSCGHVVFVQHRREHGNCARCFHCRQWL